MYHEVFEKLSHLSNLYSTAQGRTLNEAPRLVIDYISKLKIHCDFYPRGCPEMVQVGNLKRHVSTCGFSPVQCSNEGCKAVVNARDKLHHTAEVSDFRKLKCHECAEVKELLRMVLARQDKIKEELKNDMKRMKEEVKVDVKGEIKAVKNELKQETKGMKDEIKAEVKGEMKQVKGEVKAMKNELKQETKGIKSGMKEIKNEITEMKEKMNLMGDDMNETSPEMPEGIVGETEDNKENVTIETIEIEGTKEVIGVETTGAAWAMTENVK